MGTRRWGRSLLSGLALAALAAPGVDAASCGTAAAQDARAACSIEDPDWLDFAARTDLGEIALAELALERARDPDVVAYAERMIEDHSALLGETRSLARACDVELPDAPSAKAREARDALSDLDGEEFDRAYIDRMVDDHVEAVQRTLAAALLSGDDPVRDRAREELPVLWEHLKSAVELRERLSQE